MKKLILLLLVLNCGCIMLPRHTLKDVNDPNKYPIEQRKDWKELKDRTDDGYIIIEDSIDKENEIKEKELIDSRIKK